MTRSSQRAQPATRPHHSLPHRIKVRLQFTGWLQYLITAAAAAIFLIIAGIGALVGVRPLCSVALVIGGLLLLAAVFDVLTIKAGLRPPERLPRRRDDLDTFDLMRSRRSCRSFQTRVLTDPDREELLGAIREHNRLDGHIGANPIRLEYLAAPLNVWPTVGAHEFIVAIAPREYDRLAIIDIGRNLQKAVLHATRIGVATCWIGPGADQGSIVSHLGERFDADRDHVVCVCALGYRSMLEPLSVRVIELIQRRRLPLASLFFADPRLLRPLALDAPPFVEFGRCYEVCQWSPSAFDSQPTRCVVATNHSGQNVTHVDFYASTSSRYYAPLALGIWCANWEVGANGLGLAGDFRILTAEQREVADTPEPPHYDVSWIPDLARADSIPARP